MSTRVPRGDVAQEETSNVVFVGPSASGKTTSLILLHETCLDYRDDLNMVYTPNIRTAGFNLYQDTSNLILQGIPPPPTNPSEKDHRVELTLEFKSFMRRKAVKLVFADMSGGISSTLMKVFPSLATMTPDEVKSKLLDAGLNEEDVDHLVRSLLSAKGVILVADASKIGQPDTPDGDLAYYLDNLNQFVKSHGEAPKGVALLLTKFDQWRIQMPNPTDEELRKMVKNFLPQVDNYASNFNRDQKTQYKVFYSMLNETKDKDGHLKFSIEIDNPRHMRRVEYSVEQYLDLIKWLKATFGS
jgi:hypothetical protein